MVRGHRIAAQEYEDMETGQKKHGLLVLAPEAKPGIDGEFFMSRQMALLRLAAEKRIDNQDLRVLLVYFACADWENYVQVTQKWIADHLGMHRSNVARSTKNLVEAKILEEVGKLGRNKIYRIHDFYGWKGDSRNYQKKVKEEAKLQQKGI